MKIISFSTRDYLLGFGGRGGGISESVSKNIPK